MSVKDYVFRLVALAIVWTGITLPSLSANIFLICDGYDMTIAVLVIVAACVLTFGICGRRFSAVSSCTASHADPVCCAEGLVMKAHRGQCLFPQEQAFRAGQGKTLLRFEQLTEATPFQTHLFELLEIKPYALCPVTLHSASAYHPVGQRTTLSSVPGSTGLLGWSPAHSR